MESKPKSEDLCGRVTAIVLCCSRAVLSCALYACSTAVCCCGRSDLGMRAKLRVELWTETGDDP